MCSFQPVRAVQVCAVKKQLTKGHGIATMKISPRTKKTTEGKVCFSVKGLTPKLIKAATGAATLFEALKKLALEAFLFLLLVRELLRLLKQ